MQISEKVKQAVTKAFNKLSDAQTLVTYIHVESGGVAYDPSTGEVTKNETTKSVNGLLTSFSSTELKSGEVHSTGRKFTVLQTELGITPNFGADRIVANGISYVIEKGTQDPYKTIWTLYLKEG